MINKLEEETDYLPSILIRSKDPAGEDLYFIIGPFNVDLELENEENRGKIDKIVELLKQHMEVKGVIGYIGLKYIKNIETSRHHKYVPVWSNSIHIVSSPELDMEFMIHLHLLPSNLNKSSEISKLIEEILRYD